jgi:hypothetical protein
VSPTKNAESARTLEHDAQSELSGHLRRSPARPEEVNRPREIIAHEHSVAPPQAIGRAPVDLLAAYESSDDVIGWRASFANADDAIPVTERFFRRAVKCDDEAVLHLGDRSVVIEVFETEWRRVRGKSRERGGDVRTNGACTCDAEDRIARGSSALASTFSPSPVKS